MFTSDGKTAQQVPARCEKVETTPSQSMLDAENLIERRDAE